MVHYSKTRIYSVFGVPEGTNGENAGDNAIGSFYVQFTGGGFTPHSDGQGGTFLEGTFELTILQAIGVYRTFAGGGRRELVNRGR